MKETVNANLDNDDRAELNTAWTQAWCGPFARVGLLIVSSCLDIDSEVAYLWLHVTVDDAI